MAIPKKNEVKEELEVKEEVKTEKAGEATKSMEEVVAEIEARLRKEYEEKLQAAREEVKSEAKAEDVDIENDLSQAKSDLDRKIESLKLNFNKDIVFLRKTGHKYNYRNGYNKSDGYGGVVIRQGILLDFKQLNDLDPTGTLNVTKTAEKYVNSEVISQNIDEKDREKKVKEEIYNIIKFLLTHKHYRQGKIWPEPSAEDRAISLRNQALALQAQAEALLAADNEEAAEALKKEIAENLVPPQKSKPTGKPVGIINNAASVANNKRGQV